MKTPRSVDIAITSRCNLRCQYCFHFSGPGDTDKELPTADWLAFIQELGECAVMNVTLEGGEPFCRADLPEIIAGIVQNRMRYSLLSNGTLITDDVARYIASTNRCDSVQISIDGSKAEIHDSCRGEGNFDKAVRGVDILKQHGIPVQVRLTIHKHNVRDLEEAARFLLEDIGLPGFSTNSAGYLGLCRQNSGFVQLDVSERLLAMETLLRLNEKYRGRISATAGPLAEARHWREIEEARQVGEQTSARVGHLTGCGGMWDKIAVRADGIIVPCIMLSHIELGRINRDSLREVWLEHDEMKKLRTRHTIPLDNFPYCQDCAYKAHCTGNCPGTSYTLAGDAYAPSPDACLKKYLAEGGKLPGAR
ncbi:MAG: SynChlorMet cassette radical SAM/SPASM protein ScmE [Syntrophomonas sp.]